MSILQISEDEAHAFIETLSNIAILKMLYDDGCEVKGFNESYRVEPSYNGGSSNESTDIFFCAASYYFERSNFSWSCDLENDEKELYQSILDGNDCEFFVSLKSEQLNEVLSFVDKEKFHNQIKSIFKSTTDLFDFYEEVEVGVTDNEILIGFFYGVYTYYDLAVNVKALKEHIDSIIKSKSESEINNEHTNKSNRQVA